MKWLILAGLIYLAWRLARSAVAMGGRTRRTVQPPGDAGDDVMVQDPVCGVFFPKRDGVVLEKGGVEMVFCSNECKNKYLNEHP